MNYHFIIVYKLINSPINPQAAAPHSPPRLSTAPLGDHLVFL
jgi:hypothetical protein